MATEIPMGQAFGDEDGWLGLFVPGEEELLYLESDLGGNVYTLYAYGLTEYGVSERRMLATGVTELTPIEAGACYRVQEPDFRRESLYMYRGGESSKVASGVGAFVALPDGSRVYYLKDDGTLFVQETGGTSAISLAAGVTGILAIQ